MLKRRLHRLVLVYTCQNATLLEITCHGSCYVKVNSAIGHISISGLSGSLLKYENAIFNCGPKMDSLSR